jgi:hypothetical protein
MDEAQDLESTHERRVTWSLIAIVFAFVLLMTCIILWITGSLIRNQRGSGSPTIAPASATPISYTATAKATATKAPTLQTETPTGPILVDATWTPVPGGNRYVRFLYWYVRPNRIKVGECLQLTWQTEYAVSLQLYRNGELILDDAPPAKTLQDCPTRPGYVVYRLVAQNSARQSNWIQLQVKVVEAP